MWSTLVRTLVKKQDTKHVCTVTCTNLYTTSSYNELYFNEIKAQMCITLQMTVFACRTVAPTEAVITIHVSRLRRDINIVDNIEMYK